MPSILIIDDDVSLLQQLQASLSDLADVRVGRRAADVQRLCRQAAPDLLLLDLRLDDGDGLQLLEQLRADASLADIPVMFLTSEHAASQRVRGYDLDVVDWLIKPIDAARLRLRVQKALDRAHTPAMPTLSPQGSDTAVVDVLAVDDDPIILDALANALTDASLRLSKATYAAQALEAVVRRVPGLVLLDIGLPGADGFQLAEQLQAIPAMVDVPIIFVTQYGDFESEDRALGMGAFDYVSKPFLPSVLRARVRNALRQRQRAMALLQHAELHWRRVSSEQLSAIVAHARDAIIAIDDDGRIALVNEAARRLLGDASAPVAGQALPGWLHTELPSELLTGAMQHVEGLVFRPPERGVITCDVSAVVDMSGGRRLVTLTVKDQTLRLRAEAEARENLRLQAESRTRQLMMSYLAHEIGNSLNGVVNFTALLLGPGADPLTAEQTRRLRLVSECADVLQHLMADALDLARSEAGQFSLRLVPQVVRDAVNYAVDSVRPAAQARQITLAQPRGDLGAVVLADDVRLRQCVFNLVSNACKYGRSGGTVGVDVLDSGDEVAISVSDEGAGMTPDQVQRLFEPFERLGRAGSAGHGLGLAVTRMLMQAMGGRIDVSSMEGVGSRFTLVLRKPRAHQEITA